MDPTVPLGFGLGLVRKRMERILGWTFVWGEEPAGVFPRRSGFLTLEIFFCFCCWEGGDACSLVV